MNDTVRKFIHNENVKLSLESLSTTENPGKHKEANIEWLENELEKAKENIDLLDDELKFIHNENVKLSLESLSTTENPGKHKEANIEWLENELEKAKENIDLVREWIKKCNEL
ncbi:hypothetical protein Glove_79g89 [Diversispora epigaea]|uniref:Uncharacterized protein n=1 Tax=Diversispora epigaea TaxID=1348612 RepID=A0A397J8B3_9GLOM|nr:hypothetical protein Glove_79g89 [Diversispora epigaea]